jgi:hypothetical protein
MGSFVSIARARRTPLAVCLSAALAFASTASAATPAENLLHRRGDGLAPLFEQFARRATTVRAVPHGSRRPEGGTVIPVTSCADDGGSGTLRHSVLVASSGDTVDLSALSCSTITLAAGAIGVDVDDLTILGPGASRLTIDAAHASRVFRHGGGGTLQVANLTVANGSYSPPTGPYGGGCIYSAANLSMTGAVATGCTASASGVIAGGAVLALNSVVMFASAITDSTVTSINGYGSTAAAGGGGFSGGNFVFEHSIISGNSATAPTGTVYGGGGGGINVTAKYSTVRNNVATTVPDGGHYAIGGGIICTANVFIQNTTIEGNSADGAGGIDSRTFVGYSVKLIDTTISGNHARVVAGGMLASSDLTIQNSTIAFNDSGSEGGGGLIAEGTNLELESTIIADNSPSGGTAAADLDGSATVSGANNLVKISGLTLPGDTIELDPQLGPLAANGGETRTHALAAASPAIDGGNEVSGIDFDQRGPEFPRHVGAFADIGAYELDGEVIFDDRFDAGGD